jgi:putative tryptophan/tyrosine transport system substrate-binding protein
MAMHIRRRKFIVTLGGAATLPFVARAQQGEPRIGLLMNGVPTEPTYRSYADIFVKTLQTLGWRDGQNLRLDIRWSASDPKLIHYYAEELVATAPDLIVAASTANLQALLQTTNSIPIVFLGVSDPVAQGFVSNLGYPGGNITGFVSYELSMGGKWIDLLKQMVPSLARIAVVFNPDAAPQSKVLLRSIESAALTFQTEVIAAPVHNEAEIERAIETVSREPNGGVLLAPDSFTAQHNDLIIALVARRGLPAIYANSETAVRRGGLMYYGIDFEPGYRQAAVYVDSILKGAKPGDLPIQMPTNFKFIVNLKTARALGIEVPMGLMLRADEMIE